MTKMKTTAKPAAYHVYCTLTPTNAGYEGTRKTLHNARRLAASLRRAGFDTSITACVVDGKTSWCEFVESVDLSQYLATARGEEIAALVNHFAS